MQTVLGAGGAISTELARALKKYTNRIRLVSRNPKRVNDSDELFKADLTKPNEHTILDICGPVRNDGKELCTL